MEGSMTPLAGGVEFFGPVIPLQMREDVAAPVDPARIAEAADRANGGPDQFAAAKKCVLDWSDGASLGPTPSVI
jgi:hypothetical protein